MENLVWNLLGKEILAMPEEDRYASNIEPLLEKVGEALGITHEEQMWTALGKFLAGSEV